MRNYKELAVWKKAHAQYVFIKENISIRLPKEERYELTSQLNRASLSIPLNIVEGAGRFSNKDFAHFLDTSLGSTNEVEYCCFVAFELKMINEADYALVSEMMNEIRAMLIGFLQYLRKNEKKCKYTPANIGSEVFPK